MSSAKASGITRILCFVLLGMAAFLMSGIAACIMILLLDSYLLAMAVAGGFGGLFLGIFLRMRRKLIRMTLAGLIGMPVGLAISFFIVEGVGSLLPSIGAALENTPVPDIIAVLLMGMIFGAIFGSVNYGLKSILPFSVVCGIVSIPFGFLVVALNAGYGPTIPSAAIRDVLEKIDWNFLAITVSLGIGTGLSIGLFHTMPQANADGSL